MKRKIWLQSFLVTIIILTAALCSAALITAYADDSYSIPSVKFDVELEPDGSALIHESWNVKYNGSFHRFRHGYLIDLPKAQKFDKIDTVEFRINGEVVNETSSGKDMTACVLSENDERQLCWYKKTKGSEEVSYEAVYRLTNVVKEYDGEEIFSCRFIGLNFEKKIDSVSVTIKKIPSMDLKKIESNYGSVSVPAEKNEGYTVEKSNVNGRFMLTYYFKNNRSTPYFTSSLTSIKEADLYKALNKRTPAQQFTQKASVVAGLIMLVVLFVIGKKHGMFNSSMFGGFTSSHIDNNFGGGIYGCGGGGCGGGSGCGGGGAS